MKMLFKSFSKPAPKKPAEPAKPAAKVDAPKPAEKKPAKADSELENPTFIGLLALLKQHGAGGQFGAHNVAEGDHVAFTAGEFSGSGAVTAAGEHGATILDKTEREHRVHWHEVTAHKPGKGKAKDAV